MNPIYAQRIREVRQSENLTQAEFAQRIGTTKNQLSKYELNTQETPIRIIIAICENFAIDANWLLGLSNDFDLEKVPFNANERAASILDYIHNLEFKSYPEFIHLIIQDDMLYQIKKYFGMMQAYLLVCEKLGQKADPTLIASFDAFEE